MGKGKAKKNKQGGGGVNKMDENERTVEHENVPVCVDASEPKDPNADKLTEVEAGEKENKEEKNINETTVKDKQDATDSSDKQVEQVDTVDTVEEPKQTDAVHGENDTDGKSNKEENGEKQDGAQIETELKKDQVMEKSGLVEVPPENSKKSSDSISRSPDMKVAEKQERGLRDFKVGDLVTEELLNKMSRLERQEKRIADIIRAYKQLNQMKKAVEEILRAETHVESLGDVEGLSQHFKNMNMIVSLGREEIGRLSEEIKALKETETKTQSAMDKLREEIDSKEKKNSDLAKTNQKLVEEIKKQQQVEIGEVKEAKLMQLANAILDSEDTKSDSSEVRIKAEEVEIQKVFRVLRKNNLLKRDDSEERKKVEGELAEEISKLKAEVTAQKETNNKLSATNVKLATTIKESTARRLDIEKRIDVHQNELKEKNNETKKLQQEIEEHKKVNSSLKREAQEAVLKLQEKDKAIEINRKSIEEKENELKRMSELKMEIEKKVQKMEEESKQENELAKEYGQKIKSLQADLQQSRKFFSEKSVAYTELSKKHNELKYSYEILENTKKVSEKNQQEIIENLQQEIGSLAKSSELQVAELNKTITGLQETINNLTENLPKQDEIDQMKEEIANNKMLVESLQTTNKKLEEKSFEYINQLSKAELLAEENRDLKSSLELVKSNNESLLSRHKKTINDLRDEIRRLQREILVVKTENQNILSSVSPIVGATPTGNALSSPTVGQSVATPLHRGFGPDAPASHTPFRSSSMTNSKFSLFSPVGSINARLGYFPTQQSQHSASSGKGRTGTTNTNGIGTASTPGSVSDSVLTFSPDSNFSLSSPAENSQRVEKRGSALSTGSGSSQNDVVNIDYLRNVLFKFFKDRDRRSQLIPVLSTLLNCSAEEIKKLQNMIL
ncbi:hypothetical protein AX774_g8205 [Zancudomyces culisetae]|uniref:GRIP domain-containing protein n=1 Tax=Zancudomyces culisetae TaxID=1213189 RepID=A0A1R1PBN8_ZANCU|nr:hypothetical protein AX774_g8226 [Zancudomyces culisetae]OMH78405.1 hypothetical protein AX774_g8205 [Zancudomyces culisetae]|eukprot:OMH78387.1 hypothetical protein AX774_g8226 [Zancudomyces culisetae]